MSADPLVIGLGTGGNGEGYARGGWSNPEDGFRWMVGFESFVVINDPPPSPAGYELSFTVLPHIREGKLPRQRLIVAANDLILKTFELTGPVTCRCAIAAAPPRGEALTLRFIHPDGTAPKVVADIADTRDLSIAIKEITLAPAETAGAAPFRRPAAGAGRSAPNLGGGAFAAPSPDLATLSEPAPSLASPGRTGASKRGG